MSTTIETTYRKFLESINLQKWDSLQSIVSSPTINLNGETVPVPEGIKSVFFETLQDLTIEIITVDEEAGRLGAILSSSKGADNNRTEHHHLIWISKEQGGIITALAYISSSSSSPIPFPISSPAAPSKPPLLLLSKPTLQETYKSYINSINARTMTSRLSEFCHDTVTHNSNPYSLSEYRGLMESAQKAVPDICFGVDVLVVDEMRQRVAVRIEFEGTPVPGERLGDGDGGWEGTGRAVRFYEYVTYQFRDGKIDTVWSIVDWDTYRRQLDG
ncbi:SnoaL-domain-containing protein [Poronia punctata]|nr:SnoaL-domain-containing protein [Poronia punctata]